MLVGKDADNKHLLLEAYRDRVDVDDMCHEETGVCKAQMFLTGRRATSRKSDDYIRE